MKKISLSDVQLSLFDDDAVVCLSAVPAYVAVKTEVVQAIEVSFELPRQARNLFVLTDEHLQGLSSDKAKIEANLQAISTAQQCQRDAVSPTDVQKAAMAAFSGWGGLSEVFATNTSYPAQQQRLRELLGERGTRSAMESVLSAYYTEPAVIRAIWSMVRHLGFTGGAVLEPSCGVGHFIGAMPVELREASRVTMVELDATTAMLAGQLYGDAETMVYAMGLQDAPVRPDSFDLVIGNVPFGNYRVSDRHFDHLRMNIHDYFLAKCLDAVRPGGLVCLITSTGTLDKQNSHVRQYLAQRSDLLTAIRLPSGAFRRLGGTDVVADVLVLQKRAYSEQPKGWPLWTKELPGWMCGKGLYGGQEVSSWFVKSPSHVLGKFVLQSGRFGETLGVQGQVDWMEQLQQRCADPALASRFDPKANVQVRLAPQRRGDTGYKSCHAFGFFFAEDGRLMLLDEQSQVHSQAHLPTSTLSRIEGMTRIRDAVLELMETDARQLPQAAEHRARLNALYDLFVKRHGYLMSSHNRRLFSADSHAPVLWSLEMWDDESESAVKADVFRRATVARAALAQTAETVAQAMALSFNHFARFDLPFVAKALGRDVQAVLDELVEAGLVYLEPVGQQWVDRETYLSGEVYDKLDAAVAAQAADARFARNVQALQSVIPTPVPLQEVAIRLGVPWIGASMVEAFVQELFGLNPGQELVTHVASTATWSVGRGISYLRYKTHEWGTSRKDFASLLSDLLNQRSTQVLDREITAEGREKLVVNADETIAAREAAEKIQAAFQQWIFKDAQRVRELESLYNRRFNGMVNRRYDGSHLLVPGLNPSIELRGAQKDAIWRALVSGNTLFAQAVGGGKTLVQICVAQESKRLGIASKPCLVVPNHMLEAFAGEYLRAFPRARVLAAGKEDLSGERRRTLLMRAAMHDWDCIIITHGSFGRLAVSDEEVQSFIDEMSQQVEQSVMGATDKNAVRDAMRQSKQVQAKLEALMGGSSRDGGVLPFEQLGIDWLCVDEADLFKNLWFHTKKTRVAGLSNACSTRALDLMLKSCLIFRARGNDGFGMCFATATPIANTIAEMFVMQTYLHPWTLKRKGLDSFDAWAANFAREVTAIEVKPEGSGYRMHTRFARFVNVPELMLLFREIAEIRTKRDLALPEPTLAGGKHTLVSVPASQSQKLYVQTLVERAQAIREARVKPSEDNMLRVTNDGRQAALDMRCIDPHEPDHLGSKVNACVQRVYGHWREGCEDRLTQLVFCDLSVPGGRFSVYEDMRDKLVGLGVPDREIAFAQDYKTDKAKAELHRKVRQGLIRILIGSTELMGFGTNVQDRLIAKHDLDAPWRPRDVEQRDGRIIRQKNRNEVVHIYRYVTEQTFDAYMWQTLERKAGFIAQVMEHTGEARTVEDVTSQALSFAEVKALASGNPMVIEKAGVDADVARLLALQSVFASDQRKKANELHYAREGVAHQRRRVEVLEHDLQNLGDARVLTVQGQTLHDPLLAGKAIMRVVAAAAETHGQPYLSRLPLAQVGNAQLQLVGRGTKQLTLQVSTMAHEVSLPYGAELIAQALQGGCFASQLQQQLEYARTRIGQLEHAMASLQASLAAPFEHASALDAALARQAEIDASLEIDQQDRSATGLETEVSQS